MENKITLRFTLDSFEKIGFDAGHLPPELGEDLHNFHESGIIIDAKHYDDLCKNTINNGHNLLKSNGIFNIDTSIVNPMSQVIGQYLFRLLFGHTEFHNTLHWARKTKKELDIELNFDLSAKESKDLALLPWELMYCPDSPKPDSPGDEENEDESDGFFLSQAASIYRRYQTVQENDAEIQREVYVSVAFLTKDIENLWEVHRKCREIAGKVEALNSNIHFEFINSFDEDKKVVHFLTKEDLGRIFLKDKNKIPPQEVNKVVHIICDVSTIEYKARTDKALYFNKTGVETESISYTEIFQELFAKSLLPDPYLKLMVLQAWKDENRFVFTGFEELAHRMMKKNQPAIISMPYVLNQEKAEDGKAAFFQILYTGLARSESLLQVVQQLRNEVVQRYAYGFPILYLNGQDRVLVRQENISQKTLTEKNRKTASSDIEEELNNRYQYADVQMLEEAQQTLKEKLRFISEQSSTTTDTDKKFADKKLTEKINLELSAIEKHLIRRGASNP